MIVQNIGCLVIVLRAGRKAVLQAHKINKNRDVSPLFWFADKKLWSAFSAYY
ncbi:hypothetical protein KNP414_04358 [Paenibacillus mucilaginosus KNP414]|uniref:Uncharacterized protein n=1 Tax=Paenibacillus mucilaginosus (strain KNP414) TaxID=1036673 RepID=F8FJP0_PAEMK|nr:hypothetical protein KNP414_04358 [Paenibacillus mucilaginosus KNP414]